MVSSLIVFYDVSMMNNTDRCWFMGTLQEAMTAEATDLVNASFGEVMLHAVGRVYRLVVIVFVLHFSLTILCAQHWHVFPYHRAQATIYLGNIIDSSIASLKAKGRSIKSQFQAGSMALKVYQTQQQLAKLDVEAEKMKEQAAIEAKRQAEMQLEGINDGDDTASKQDLATSSFGPSANGNGTLGGDAAKSAEDLKAMAAAMAAQKAQLEEQSLPLMLDAMWAANTLDIEATVRHVCKKVLNDPQATKDVRNRRANGLLQLGNIFYNAKSDSSKDAAADSKDERKRHNNDATSDAAKKERAEEAKKHMEAAMQKVIEKRMAADDAAYQGYTNSA